MKFRRFLHLLPALTAGGAMMVSMAACGKDEPEGGKNDLRNRVYQQYEVRIINNSIAAYANLRRSDASGERVHLSGASSLSVNDQEMYYTPTQTQDFPEFNYSLPIAPDAAAVTYTLKVNDDFSLTNSLPLASLPEIGIILENNAISPSSPLRLDMAGLAPEDVTVILDDFVVGGAASPIQGTVSASGIVVFPNLPEPGRYYLTVTLTRTFPTSQNDGAASGSIKGIRISTHRVTVTD
ncbi:MAG: hypothetical protein K2O24_02835 [Muribaculaceae bacterium]|nr:hypothetical protein [Muribaculaceae bacterium]